MNPVARSIPLAPRKSFGNSLCRGHMVAICEVVDDVGVGSFFFDQLNSIEVSVHKSDFGIGFGNLGAFVTVPHEASEFPFRVFLRD